MPKKLFLREGFRTEASIIVLSIVYKFHFHKFHLNNCTFINPWKFAKEGTYSNDYLGPCLTSMKEEKGFEKIVNV